ncbi:50S ribosomal protein L24e [Candidatus Woesearchaeota archaeon]|nr:50S ribosomal protein L24e [Candidatus Woesearchaeota archaeon]
MVKCSFCGEELPAGTGLMYVKKDGRVLYFDKKKCEKNLLKLNRKARTTKWTKDFVKGEQ